MIHFKFRRTGSPTHLVFGDEDFRINATLPALAFVGVANTGDRYELEAAAALPAMVFAGTLSLDITGTLNAVETGDDVFAGTLAQGIALQAAATLPPMTFAGRLASTIFQAEGALPLLAFTGVADFPLDVTIIPFPEMAFTAALIYDSQTQRPLVSQVAAKHQQAIKSIAGAQIDWQMGGHRPAGVQSPWQQAIDLTAGQSAGWGHSISAHQSHSTSWERGIDIRTGQGAGWDRSIRLRQSRSTSWERGIDVRQSRSAGWTLTLRQSRPRIQQWHQRAVPLSIGRQSAEQRGLGMQVNWQSYWQLGIVPPPGLSTWVIPVQPWVPCYTPSARLVFRDPPSSSTHLLFFCGDTRGIIIVPVKGTYIVLNTISLKRVSDDLELPATSLSLSLDRGSWTWGFTASLPASALADLDDEDVELEANINGNIFRLILESISRDRTFQSATISISGRGKNAVLDENVTTFANASDMLASQLMGEVLTFTGWDIDFHLDDWLIPTGCWSYQGTRIKALDEIAVAVGGYLQPHRTLETIRVLKVYPEAPWDWVDADYELPSALVVSEGISWINKPMYNRVFVQGEGAGGRRIQATREGTDGALVAPMVVDRLITDVVAGRQRATQVLSDVGRQATVTIRLPVLTETGVIEPGKFVRYVDGGTTRLGLVRGVNVRASRPNVYQELELETHE